MTAEKLRGMPFVKKFASRISASKASSSAILIETSVENSKGYPCCFRQTSMSQNLGHEHHKLR
jgi:hypothetical protein